MVRASGFGTKSVARGSRSVGTADLASRFLLFHIPSVTSDLARQFKSRNHGRGHDGWLYSPSSRAKSFVSRILTPKFFDIRILQRISCKRDDPTRSRGRGVSIKRDEIAPSQALNPRAEARLFQGRIPQGSRRKGGLVPRNLPARRRRGGRRRTAGSSTPRSPSASLRVPLRSE
jgi:hypothetical protein